MTKKGRLFLRSKPSLRSPPFHPNLFGDLSSPELGTGALLAGFTTDFLVGVSSTLEIEYRPSSRDSQSEVSNPTSISSVEETPTKKSVVKPG
jgi:hypothetical protein